jgi:hypothetical protein
MLSCQPIAPSGQLLIRRQSAVLVEHGVDFSPATAGRDPSRACIRASYRREAQTVTGGTCDARLQVYALQRAWCTGCSAAAFQAAQTQGHGLRPIGANGLIWFMSHESHHPHVPGVVSHSRGGSLSGSGRHSVAGKTAPNEQWTHSIAVHVSLLVLREILSSAEVDRHDSARAGT